MSSTDSLSSSRLRVVSVWLRSTWVSRGYLFLQRAELFLYFLDVFFGVVAHEEREVLGVHCVFGLRVAGRLPDAEPEHIEVGNEYHELLNIVKILLFRYPFIDTRNNRNQKV